MNSIVETLSLSYSCAVMRFHDLQQFVIFQRHKLNCCRHQAAVLRLAGLGRSCGTDLLLPLHEAVMLFLYLREIMKPLCLSQNGSTLPPPEKATLQYYSQKHFQKSKRLKKMKFLSQKTLYVYNIQIQIIYIIDI